MISNYKRRPSFTGSLITTPYGSGKTVLMAEQTKNLQISTDCGRNLNIATLNVRTLKDDDRLEKLAELENLNFDIIGLSEIRRQNEELLNIKNGHQFYYRGTANGRKSCVGFIVNNRLKGNILSFNSLSDRVASLVIKLSNHYTMLLVQVYAPTSQHSDDKVGEFYEVVSSQFIQQNIFSKL